MLPSVMLPVMASAKLSFQEAYMNAGPTGHWQLGEQAGTAAEDYGGKSVAGTYTNTPTLGKASLFPFYGASSVGFAAASSEHVTMGDQPGLEGNATMAGCIWMKPPAQGAAHVFSKDSATGYGLFLQTGSSVSFFTRDAPTPQVVSTTSVDDNVARFVAYTLSGNEAKIFIDGVNEATNSSWTTPTSNAGSFSVAAQNAAGLFLEGDLQELAVWIGATLSPAQIEQFWLCATTGEVTKGDSFGA